MALTKEERETLTEIKTAICGIDGQGGLIKQVQGNTKKINKLNIITASIIGSGILGGSAIATVLNNILNGG